VAMTRAKAGVIIIGDRRPRAQHQYCDSQRRRNSRRIRIISGPWSRASLPADQHGQPGVDVLESRAIEEGGRAGNASDGDEEEDAGTGASLHANQHGQFNVHLEIPGTR
jgi:hypothetical protein